MQIIDRSKPVLVTGATGYVASWLVKKLLDTGLTVHAAVRNPAAVEKTGFLKKLADDAPGSLKLFTSDLLQDGSYGEAMQGCELVFHTASPFTSNFSDPQKELVDPALLGTRNVLHQANNTETVKRVVVTSSCAAIYGDTIDILSTPGKMYTEKIWNTTSSLSHQPYSYSKVVAEQEAWSIYKKQSRWHLVTINPSLVLGPALNPQQVTSDSFTILKQLGSGTLKNGAPNLGLGVVDVRDLAYAHYQAGFVPDAAGRHIVSGYNTSLLALSQTLLAEFGDRFPLPRREMPKLFLWLIGPLLSKTVTRKFVSRNVGYPFIADNTKCKRSLGATFRPLEETMLATFRQLVENNLLTPRKPD